MRFAGRSVIVWALAATTGGGCLLIDDLTLGPTADTPAGGAPATTTTITGSMAGSMASTMTTGATTTTASSMAASMTSTGSTGSTSTSASTASSSTGSDGSSSTGCMTPPGNPAMCEGGAPNMSCTLSENCACEDCWSDGNNCPAAFCNHNGSCDPVSETCLCCDCADKAACNP